MNEKKISFTGEGLNFLLLFLKVAILSVFTLGIYYFWGKVEIRKFFYNNTKFENEGFEYHSTGKELFIGFLKLMGVIIGAVILIGIVSYLLGLISPTLGSLMSFLFIPLEIVLIPIIVFSAIRFVFSRTSYKGRRFQFIANSQEFFIMFIKGILLTAVTFGIYFPWFFVDIRKFIATNTIYGNYAFDSRMDGKEYFFINLKGFFLSIITFGIYFSWFIATTTNYKWNNLHFANGKFKANLTGGQVFITILKCVGISIITLGIGVPIARVIFYKYLSESISFEGEIDYAQIQEVPLNKTSSMFDSMLDSLGDSFGAF